MSSIWRIRVGFPIPGTPQIKTREPDTTLSPSVRSNSERPVVSRISGAREIALIVSGGLIEEDVAFPWQVFPPFSTILFLCQGKSETLGIPARTG